MCKIIVYIPVKNDKWCIENSIRHAVQWADYVIVADESSTDGSWDIYKKLGKEYTNLKIISNKPKMDFCTPDPRNYMLEQVRKIEGNNVIFELHADEIVSAKILNREIKTEIINKLSVGQCLELPWLTLWKDPLQYRSDKSVWGNNTCIFAFRDDRKSQFQSAAFHGHRAPETFVTHRIKMNNLPVLHYQFINIGADMSKQALYHIFERNHYPNKNVESINKLYAASFDERKLRCEKLKEEDYLPWIEIGLNIHQVYDDDTFNWRDEEVLKNFKKYGLDRYAKINIWNIDWEKKRQQALKIGIQNIPSFEIVDPRSLSTRLAHRFFNKYQMYPFWTIDFLRLIISKGPQKLFNKLKQRSHRTVNRFKRIALNTRR